MGFLIIYFLVQISVYGTALGHFSQCEIEVFRRRPTNLNKYETSIDRGARKGSF